MRTAKSLRPIFSCSQSHFPSRWRNFQTPQRDMIAIAEDASHSMLVFVGKPQQWISPLTQIISAANTTPAKHSASGLESALTDSVRE